MQHEISVSVFLLHISRCITLDLNASLFLLDVREAGGSLKEKYQIERENTFVCFITSELGLADFKF